MFSSDFFEEDDFWPSFTAEKIWCWQGLDLFLPQSLWFLPFKTSKGGFLNIAAIWHVVPDTQICPQASSSISLFSLLHFSEQKNDSELRKQRELKQEKVARRHQIYFKCVLNLFKATVKWNFNGSQRYKKSGMGMQRLYHHCPRSHKFNPVLLCLGSTKTKKKTYLVLLYSLPAHWVNMHIPTPTNTISDHISPLYL